MTVKVFGCWELENLRILGFENRRMSGRIENRRISRIEIFGSSVIFSRNPSETGNEKLGGGDLLKKKIVGSPCENKWIFGSHRLDFLFGGLAGTHQLPGKSVEKLFFVGSRPPKTRT